MIKKNGGTDIMKELRNNVDTEVVFTKLEEAKEWYLPKIGRASCRERV